MIECKYTPIFARASTVLHCYCARETRRMEPLPRPLLDLRGQTLVLLGAVSIAFHTLNVRHKVPETMSGAW